MDKENAFLEIKEKKQAVVNTKMRHQHPEGTNSEISNFMEIFQFAIFGRNMNLSELIKQNFFPAVPY